MFAIPVARRFLSAAAIFVVVTAPCVAQTSAAPQASPKSLTPAEIAAFAKLELTVRQARDSIQAQLAQSRNKTPQAQQQLREKLAAQIAEILHHAGTSDAEFRRKTYIVSTDSGARAVFDETIAKLTGAPLPGKLQPAAPAVKVPAGMVGTHIGHVVNAFAQAPNGQSLLGTAMAEARVAVQHAGLAGRDPANLDAMKLHAGHVIHAIDPSIVTMGPGQGYGVKAAASGIATHIDLAAKAPGASQNVVTHASHIATSAKNSVQRADQIVAVAKQIQEATTAAAAASLVSQLVSLTNQLVAGNDANADGKVTWQDGEGGLQQCDEHVKLMLAAEPMP